MNRRIQILAVLIFASISVKSQISTVNFSSGYSQPVDIKNCGDDRLFIVEQTGTIRISDTDGVKFSRPFLDITTRSLYGSEQGVLGLAFPADYLTSGYFYVNYTAKPNGNTRISRFHVDPAYPDTVDPNTEEILLTIYQPYSNHNGGHIAFGPDGYLYIGMGDGGSGGDPQNRAQNPDSLLGKMLRIEVSPSDSDYAIPPTNPFADDSTLGRGEIWALGLRNPWRFSFDALNGDLWIGDVGQNLIEEIDMQPGDSKGGLNYGWKCWEADDQYSSMPSCQPYTFYEPPVHQYNHGGPCSVSGGYVYRGSRFQELYGKYFYADYCVSSIQYLVPNGAGGFANTNLGSLGPANISSFGVDRHNELYCAGLNSGIIYKFVSANCSPVATINLGNDTIDDCNTGSVDLSVPFDSSNSYLWILNGDTVSTTSAHTAILAGEYYVYVTRDTCSNSDSVYVDFTLPINLSFSGLDTVYCIYSAPSNLLPSHIPGTFSGPGITGATFDPMAANAGTHTITYDYTNSSGCHYSTSQDVRVDICFGVPENTWTNTIGVYPNPSGRDFFVHAFTNSGKKLSMEILDVTGRLVINEEFVIGAGDNRIPISTSLTNGIYIVKFADEISNSSLKLVVQ